MQIPFVGEAYTSLAKQLNDQTCINLYPAKADSQSKYSAALFATPGLSVFANITGGSVRGSLEQNGIYYCVVDNIFYQVSSTGTFTNKGTLNTSTGRVAMIANYTQIMVTDGTNGYVYTIGTGTFATITDVNFVVPQSLTYQDGYGIFVQPGTFNVQLTNLSDFTTYDSLKVQGVSSDSDYLVTVVSLHSELWVLGKKKTEIWYNAGSTPFPFARRAGVYIDAGCAAQYSVVKVDNTIFWLGSGQQGMVVVYRANGYTPQKISSEFIDKEISSYSTISDAFAYAYQENGHEFYLLTFPTMKKTWVYDISTGMWHERKSTVSIPSLSQSEPEQTRHISNCYSYCYGKHLVGDYQSGKIYQMSQAFYDDAGTAKIWERTFPHVTQEQKNIFVSSFELDAEKGVGLTTGQGSDPQVILQYSKDGGQTWSTELWRSLGKVGEYTKRVRWLRLGKARTWTFRLRGSDSVLTSLFNVIASGAIGDS